MINIPGTKLYVGSKNDFIQIGQDENSWAFVHATQAIHYEMLGWSRILNKPNTRHSNYIIYEKDNHLSLNWVEGRADIANCNWVETLSSVLDFIEIWIENREVLIHCNKGQSRGPTLALLYLAKRLNLISNKSFQTAHNEFLKFYPQYMPEEIGRYISNRWKEIK